MIRKSARPGISALSRKEFGDIVRERLYLFAFGVQLIMVVGIIYTALLYTSISSPVVAGGLIQSEVRVGIMGDFDVRAEGLVVQKIPTGDPMESLTSRDLAAVLFVPQGYEEVALKGGDLRFVLALDNTNILSGYADATMSNAVAELSEELKRKRLSKEVDPDAVLRPIDVVEYGIGAKRQPFSMEFTELIYGLLIPFILLLPVFLSTNMMTDSIVGEKEKKTYEALIAAPMSKFEIIVGKALPIIAVTMLQVIAWIILLVLRGIDVYNVASLLLLITFLDVVFVGLGIAISAFSDTIKDANAGVAVLILVASMAFFAPIASTGYPYAYSPVFMISKLASNPAVLGNLLLESYGALLILGFAVAIAGARLLDWRENLRL